MSGGQLMHSKLIAAASVSLLLFCVACRKDERASTTTTTSAAPAATSSTTDTGAIRYVTATARISGKRCDREDVCDPFGEGKRHHSRHDCDVGEYGRTKAELPEADCRNGIDDAKLRACMDAVAQQDCETLGNPLPTLEACAPPTLCAHP